MVQQHDSFHWNEDQLGDLVRAIPLFTVPPARSRSIRAIGYDQDARILALQFRSRPGVDEGPLIYGYLNFPACELEALLTAASMGQYVNTLVKPRYECVRVAVEREPLAAS
jgi:hypothetical protein